MIAIGEVENDEPEVIDNGLQHSVKMIVDVKMDKNGNPISVSPKEIKGLLNKGFYFASTRKVPFLEKNEVGILIEELKKRQLILN